MMVGKIKDEDKSLDEIKYIALRVLDYDENRNNILERKAELLLGFIGIIIPVVVGIFYYLSSENQFKEIYSNCFRVTVIFFIFSILTLLSFITSAIFCILTIKPREFKNIDLPNIWETLGRGNNIFSIKKLKINLIEHFYKIHKNNKGVVDVKANILSKAFYSLLAGLFFIAGIFIYLFFI